MTPTISLENRRIIDNFIKNTDWDLYHKRVSHAISSPSCHFHDGSIICPVWRYWVKSGRELYNSEVEYIDKIVRNHPNIPKKELLEILSDNDSD